MAAKPLTKTELRAALTPREPGDHKGVYGHALVVAGSRGMAGAAILAARAALRSGAGLVTVAAPEGAAAAVASAVPAAMTLWLPENAAGTVRPEGLKALKRHAAERRVSALAIGPGLTTHPDASRFALAVLAELPLPAVVDADALNALAKLPPADSAALLKGRAAPCVFTPHPGEAARVLRRSVAEIEGDREKAAARLAREWSGTALLKGSRTLISSGTRTVVNPTGGPALAKAGSGDVLTGLVVGLWAQLLASGRGAGDLSFQAAALGAWLHGRAGEAAEAELTPWAANSSDLVELLPGAFRALAS